MENKDKINFLLEEYRQCYEQRRHTDRVDYVVEAFFSLPIGYIITVFQLEIYYSLLGLHRAASRAIDEGLYGRFFNYIDIIDGRTAERQFLLNINGEPDLEAIWAYLSVHRMDIKPLNFLVDWSRKRIDVMAINLSIICATVFAFSVSFFIPQCLLHWQRQPERCGIYVLGGGCWIIMALMCLIYYSIRKQLIQLHILMYKKYMGTKDKKI